MSSDIGEVSLSIEAGVASVTFNRPQARNAMTWPMYEQLVAIARQLAEDRSVRAVVFRGEGGQAFVAGTDIEQFTAFQTAEDGVAYERQIEACIELLGELPQPTVAVIEGWAVGGGLAIATACDFRLATPGARLGVPIAKTLGNCLSLANVARLRAAFGDQRVKRMLMLARVHRGRRGPGLRLPAPGGGGRSAHRRNRRTGPAAGCAGADHPAREQGGAGAADHARPASVRRSHPRSLWQR